jgi:plasmid maintenance system antidote protein VapI
MDNYGEKLEAALAHQIRVELVDRAMEQQDLASKVGVNRVTMSNYMTGKRSIPMPVFFKISEVLGMSPQVLMQRAEARVQPEDRTA